MYRNEWDAAVARASALEQQLRAAQSSQSVDAATIARDCAEAAHIPERIHMARVAAVKQALALAE